MSYNASNPVFEQASANGTTPTTARTWNFSLTLVMGVAQEVDLRAYQNLNLIKNIQGIFLDNSANTVQATASSSAQTLICPAQSQLSAPIAVAPNNPVITFSGSGTINVMLSNFQQPYAVIAANSTISNATTVTDPALEALILNGAFSASEALYGNNDAIVHARAGAVVAGMAPIGTNVGSIFANGGNVFLTGAELALTPDAAMSATSTYDVILAFTNGGTVAQRRIVVGTVAATGVPQTVLSLKQMNLLGVTNNEALNIKFSAIGSAGTVISGGLDYIVQGGTTNLS